MCHYACVRPGEDNYVHGYISVFCFVFNSKQVYIQKKTRKPSLSLFCRNLLTCVVILTIVRSISPVSLMWRDFKRKQRRMGALTFSALFLGCHMISLARCLQSYVIGSCTASWLKSSFSHSCGIYIERERERERGIPTCIRATSHLAAAVSSGAMRTKQLKPVERQAGVYA